jgi:hypothetical protein
MLLRLVITRFPAEKVYALMGFMTSTSTNEALGDYPIVPRPASIAITPPDITDDHAAELASATSFNPPPVGDPNVPPRGPMSTVIPDLGQFTDDHVANNQGSLASTTDALSSLSIEDPNVVPIDTLIRISDDLDQFTDAQHKRLDVYSSGVDLSEADWSGLLSMITRLDMRLKALDEEKAAELLRSHPALLAILKEAWDKRKFKEVRKLGALLYSHPLRVRILIRSVQLFFGPRYLHRILPVRGLFITRGIFNNAYALGKRPPQDSGEDFQLTSAFFIVRLRDYSLCGRILFQTKVFFPFYVLSNGLTFRSSAVCLG